MNDSKSSTRFRRLFLSLTIIAVAGVAAPSCSGQSLVTIPEREESVRPGINERFIDPNLDPSEWLGRFETESREIYQAREAIVKAVNLKQGERIADIGAGTGLFTFLFADHVGPRGWVFAARCLTSAPKSASATARQRTLNPRSSYRGWYIEWGKASCVTRIVVRTKTIGVQLWGAFAT